METSFLGLWRIYVPQVLCLSQTFLTYLRYAPFSSTYVPILFLAEMDRPMDGILKVEAQTRDGSLEAHRR